MLRFRPTLYLDRRLLSCLNAYLAGYNAARWAVRNPLEDGLSPFSEFHNWSLKRVGREPCGKGWCYEIIASAGSDEAAFDTFFELLDEFTKSAPNTTPTNA